MAKMVTCVSVGTYESPLTRGKQYELIAHDEAKRQVRVRGDNNRTRWYGEWCFDLEGGSVVSLVEWRFDDPIIDELNGWNEINNYVEVTITFDDGTERWCGLMTPEYLKNLLQPRSDPSLWSGCAEPALWGKHIIYMRNLEFETVDWTLRHMDRNNELIAHTQLIEPSTNEEEDGA